MSNPLSEKLPLEWPSAINVSQHPVGFITIVNCTAQLLCRITCTKPEDFLRCQQKSTQHDQ